jgi:hypothetical protein
MPVSLGTQTPISSVVQYALEVPTPTGLFARNNYVMEHNEVVTNEPLPRQLPNLIDCLRLEVAFILQNKSSRSLCYGGDTQRFKQHHLN